VKTRAISERLRDVLTTRRYTNARYIYIYDINSNTHRIFVMKQSLLSSFTWWC